MLLVGLAVLVLLPYQIYPPVAMDILCWGLFAISVDLLLGFTGLLSFGHAAFWGGSAYATGLIAINTGWPFPFAVLQGAVFAMAIAVPIGYLSVRRTGIYFAMVTLAFAQMLYFIVNQLRDVTGGERPPGHPEELLRRRIRRVRLVLLLLRRRRRHRHRHLHRLARRQLTVRPGPHRDPRQPGPGPGARVQRREVQDRRLRHLRRPAGLAGGVFSISHGFASLQEVAWTTSGKVVLITVLGGIGTLWGGLVGAGVVVYLEDYLASAGVSGIAMITGAIFVLIVLLFRHGIWGRRATSSASRSSPAGTDLGSELDPQPSTATE